VSDVGTIRSVARAPPFLPSFESKKRNSCNHKHLRAIIVEIVILIAIWLVPCLHNCFTNTQKPKRN
jgi:hypothetical protein